MTYLKREDRRHSLVETAARLALSQGFSAVTARAVAQEAKTAIGQIHHHFESISALKAEALEMLSTQALALIESTERAQGPAKWLARLLQLTGVGPEAGFLQLWAEVAKVHTDDAALQGACARCFSAWHHATVAAIVLGQEAHVYRSDASAEDAAWRLMAMSVGLDMIGQFGGMLDLSTGALARHLASAIERELT